MACGPARCMTVTLSAHVPQRRRRLRSSAAVACLTIGPLVCCQQPADAAWHTTSLIVRAQALAGEQRQGWITCVHATHRRGPSLPTGPTSRCDDVLRGQAGPWS